MHVTVMENPAGQAGSQNLKMSKVPGTGGVGIGVGVGVTVGVGMGVTIGVAKQSGIRVVNLRIGMVLSSSGGILSKFLPIFKLSLGGRIRNGNQYMSWIALDDLLGLVMYIIADESIAGPVNAVSSNPITNADFTATLGKVLSRDNWDISDISGCGVVVLFALPYLVNYTRTNANNCLNHIISIPSYDFISSIFVYYIFVYSYDITKKS